jgi:hypothetical protein
VMHMHGAKLRAAVQRRDRLARVEQSLRVEGLFHGMELGQFRAVVLHAHLVDLFQADAVFPGDGAAHGHAEFQDPAAEFLGAFQFAGGVGIVEDERMQVAITGMEDVADRQAVFLREGGDAVQDLGEVLARYGAVHAVVIRRQPGCRWRRHHAVPPRPVRLVP